MKVADYLASTRKLEVATRAELTGGAPFVVLSPHPDDETLGVGGLIRQACAAKQQVDVVVLTDGAGSHTHSLKYPTARLVELRRQEVLDAAAILGLSSDHIHHLDLPDAHAPSEGPIFDAAVHSVTTVVERTRARSLFVTWGFDPHCDHQAASAIAIEVAKRSKNLALWAYPIWGWHLDPARELPGPPVGRRLHIADEVDVKRGAIAAHRSQMTDLIDDDPNGFRFTEETLAPFLTEYEYFYEVNEAR